jgi:quercetin dioxygenase-like cupin family protein
MESTNRRIAIITAATLTAAGAAALLSTSATGTPPSPGAVTTTLNRATLSERVHINQGGIELKNQSAVDVLNLSTVAPAGWSSGWHEHHGPVIVSIKRGSFTVYHPDCSTSTYSAGQVFVEEPGVPVLAHAGSLETEWLTTMVLPVGAPPREDVIDGLCGVS